MKTLLVARSSNPAHIGLSSNREMYWLTYLKDTGLGVPSGTAGSRHRILSIGLFSFVLFSQEIISFFSFLFPHGWQNDHLAAIVNKSAPLFCPRTNHGGLSLNPSRYPPLNKSLWQWRGGMQWEKRNWCWLTS